MRGEDEATLRREIEKIAECGIKAVCVEARPHDDFCDPGWWHDMDIVLDEAKKRDMRVWILDDKHFPTGYANGLIETKYPERKKQYLACTVADVFGASRPLTLNVGRMLKPSIGFWEIGNPVDHAERANNWDLTDLSAPKMLGHWLLLPTALGDGSAAYKRRTLDALAHSDNLWRQRMSIVCTWKTSQQGDPSWCLRYAEKHLHHPHDLMHKAVCWMLREMGKRCSMDLLRDFLRQHRHEMPRTTLRYAIEKMTEEERQQWM
jgi:3-methyladenine DNA glycosylase AlkD